MLFRYSRRRRNRWIVHALNDFNFSSNLHSNSYILLGFPTLLLAVLPFLMLISNVIICTWCCVCFAFTAVHFIVADCSRNFQEVQEQTSQYYGRNKHSLESRYWTHDFCVVVSCLITGDPSIMIDSANSHNTRGSPVVWSTEKQLIVLFRPATHQLIITRILENVNVHKYMFI